MVSFRMFCEGVFDKETTYVSRKIVSWIKNSIKKLRGGQEFVFLFLGKQPKEDYVIRGIENNNIDYIPEELSTPDFMVSLSKGAVSSRGTYDKGLVNLYITLPINRSEFPHILFDLIPMVKNTIRHELEHSSQEEEDLNAAASSGVNPWKSKENILNYLLNRSELAARVTGLYKQAKTKHTMFVDELNEFLHHLKGSLQSRNFNKEEIESIIKSVDQKFKEYAAKRFPLKVK